MTAVTYLKQALAQAKLRQGYCAPNPSVGCVIVQQGEVIAAGNHHARGEAHAEVAALNAAGANAKGADVYVTLAPCTHTGLTPPCTDALIASQVASVTYAFADPNPAASGAEAMLAAANIPCHHIPVAEIDAFYASYAYWVRTGEAQLTAKIALSLDGCYADQGEQRVLITGEALQQVTMQQRLAHDAIMTSARTVALDDPQLNCRWSDETVIRPIIVLDSNATTPLSARIFQQGANVTILHSELADTNKVTALTAAGATCIAMPSDQHGYLEVATIPLQLGQLGYHRVWSETGGTWLHSLLKAQVLTQLFLYYGNTVLGAVGRQINLTDLTLNDRNIAWQTAGNESYCHINLVR